MALDPNLLNEKLIPAHLIPLKLTEDLENSLNELVRSRSVAVQYGIQKEFDEYVKQCRAIISLRKHKRYSAARTIAKKGLVEERYAAVINAFKAQVGQSLELAVSWNPTDRNEVTSKLASLKKELSQIRQIADQNRTFKEVTLSRVNDAKKLSDGLILVFLLTAFFGLALLRRASQTKRSQSHAPAQATHAAAPAFSFAPAQAAPAAPKPVSKTGLPEDVANLFKDSVGTLR